jgi:uncharacterized protein involved in type VI secretion and phage assembly
MTSITDVLAAGRVPAGFGGRFYGVHVAQVVDVNDPDQQGRVRIRLPWTTDDEAGYEAWARLATLMAGPDRGTWFVPDVDDEVLVAFEAGDPARPYVVGALWNGQHAPPETMDGAGRNERRTIRTRSGVTVRLSDESGRESLLLETPGGQRLRLSDGPGKVDVEDANGNRITMEASGITVQASAKVTINASQVEVSAGMVQVNAGMSRFSGVVQADTVITNSVISASYTPGAGNIW